MPRSNITAWWRRSTFFSVVAAASIVTSVNGCSDSGSVEPSRKDPNAQFWSLDVNYPAVTLSPNAPYNTVQLYAIARNGKGDSIPLTTPTVFVKTNTSDTTFTVSPTGLVSATGVPGRGYSINVTVTQFVNGAWHTVNVPIQINYSAPQRLQSISMQAPPGDSTTLWLSGASGRTVPMSGTYENSSPASKYEFAVSYSSKDPGTIQVDQYGGLTPRRIGQTWIYATAYAYGRTVTDSALYTVVDPPLKFVAFHASFSSAGTRVLAFAPAQLTIPAGGTVVWSVNQSFTITKDTSVTHYTRAGALMNMVTDSMDVQFDTPSAASANSTAYTGTTFVPYGAFQDSSAAPGSISAFAFSQCTVYDYNAGISCPGNYPYVYSPGFRMRRFTTPGTYTYRSALHPEAQGTIVVK